MTVYRRNPLLMTVMGANPGPRTRKGAEKAIDAAISSAWHRLMSGVQVPIMDIPRIFRDIKLEMAGGVPLDQAVLSVGSRYRVNRNPGIGEAIVGGMAGALLNRAMRSNPGLDGEQCSMCGGELSHMGTLGNREHYRCRACGWESSCEVQATRRAPYRKLCGHGRPVGRCPRCRARGREGRSGGRMKSNPAIRASWDKLKGRQRIAVLEFAGIPSEQAERLARRPWSMLPSSVQEEAAKGWRDTTMRTRETVQANPERLRPKSAKTWCVMCGEWDPKKGPYHKPGYGGWVKGKTICDRCYRGLRSGRRSGAAWARNPQENPGSKRRMTMTVERFAAWVKSKRDPKMWRAFLAKFRGYEKWTHGSRARKVTVEWVDTPGVNGLWITYDGGKQPESTYIMPKGSSRKGAWKHPWDTMPDIKHDPEAKIVITKLRGKSKITDFYHK